VGRTSHLKSLSEFDDATSAIWRHLQVSQVRREITMK
jgi:hypothetical protein